MPRRGKGLGLTRYNAMDALVKPPQGRPDCREASMYIAISKSQKNRVIMHTTQAQYVSAQTQTLTLDGSEYYGPVLRMVAAEPGKPLKCHAKSDDFRKKLLPRFTLSDSLYLSPETSTAASTHLANLPFEIIALIYRALGSAPSQIALALTCKTLARAAHGLDLTLSTTSAKYAGFLPREVFDVPDLMQSLVPWMPADLRLCDHCLTMRPVARDYWDGVAGCHGSNFWVTKTGWTFADASWHKRVHNICPACHVHCTLSDYVDCDGCRALGRLGDVDWSRVGDHWRRATEAELQAHRANQSV